MAAPLPAPLLPTPALVPATCAAAASGSNRKRPGGSGADFGWKGEKRARYAPPHDHGAPAARNDELVEQLKQMMTNEERRQAALCTDTASPAPIHWKDRLAANARVESCAVTAQMFAVLVDWMYDIARDMELPQEVVHAAAHYMDVFTARAAHRGDQIPKHEVQLVGVACFYIATKFVDPSPPITDDMVRACAGVYTRDAILRTEAVILNTLKFDVCTTTANSTLAAVLEDDIASMRGSAEWARAVRLTRLLVDASLLAHRLVAARQTLVACGAIVRAIRVCTAVAPDYVPPLIRELGYDSEALDAAGDDLVATLREFWTPDGGRVGSGVCSRYGPPREFSENHREAHENGACVCDPAAEWHALRDDVAACWRSDPVEETA